MSSESSQAANTTPPPSARADLITAVLLLAFGLGIVVHSAGMPTFIDVGGKSYTAPGVVPGFLGTVIAILNLSLAIRSLLRGALRVGGGKPAGHEHFAPISLARLAIAAALCVAFSIGLIGRMPFWLAIAVFVTLFIAIFEWEPKAAPARRLWRLASAAIIGVAAGLGVLMIFQQVFLVRLP